MKFNRTILLVALLFAGLVYPVSGKSQKPNRQNAKPTSKAAGAVSSTAPQFAFLWQQVDSLSNLGQPRSALAIVEKIYDRAKSERNDPQLIKSIIYTIKLNADFQENFMPKTIVSLRKEILVSHPPVKQVLQSVLAEVYWKYYQNNQYRFRNRTQVSGIVSDSVETWDLATIYNTITKTYLLSLENPDTLQRIPIGKYEAILELEVFTNDQKDTLVKAAAPFFPTLYDFLAGRALDFFTSGEAGKISPAQHFEVDQPWFFAQSFPFTANRMLIPEDLSAPSSSALRIFRNLAAFHLADKDPRPLIEIELKRLAFVHEKYALPGKDSLYLAALKQFEQVQAGSPWGTSVSYALAMFMNSQSGLYQPLVSDLHKWDVKSAVEVCEAAIRRHPGSAGAGNCKLLAQSCKEPSLRITTASAVTPGKPSLALASTKNITQLYFRLIQANPEEYAEKSGTMDRDAFYKYLASLPSGKSWSQTIPDDGDFQPHQVELAIPEVTAGFWVLLCAPEQAFKGKGVYAFTPFWATQISYVTKRNNDGSQGYFLLDRETGAPLKNLTTEVWVKTYEYRERKYIERKVQSLVSDETGYLEVPPTEQARNATNQYLKIFAMGDMLITDNFYQYPADRREEQTSRQTMFYTDRSIYRPGQTIHFKGILIERRGDQSRIMANSTTRVFFTDANGQKVAEQSLTSNIFGSVSGTFIAPLGVLPGQMTISNESGSAAFSVEEYKRPTFEVICDPLEGNYRLGSELSVTGKALAFAGNSINGATVRYRIVRSAWFPFRDWNWHWRMPVSREVEIGNGTTATDADGKFIIRFMAIPDAEIDKNTWPVFNYTVYADATDINGETQTAELQVSAGYSALMITADVPERLNLAKDTLIKVSARNFNGRKTPSAVTVKMEKLNQPARVLVERLWDRPDRHIMNVEEFHAKFPNHPFDDENNPATWAPVETVFEKTLNTASDSIINLLNPAIRLLKPGSYLLTLRATDPFGEPVELKKIVTAFSPDAKEVPVNMTDWFVPLKTAGEPGESAQFLIGTKDDQVSMITEVRVDDSLVSHEVIKLSNRMRLVEIPIMERYRGNFVVNFLFVKHNRVYSHSSEVRVPHVSKKLAATFESFRDKLEPGTKETWKLKFTAPGGKPADAEFMAGMYDASLDQFRSHAWSFPIYTRYSGNILWDVDGGFRTGFGQWIEPSGIGGEIFIHPELKLNWFGAGYFGGNMRYARHSAGSGEKGRPMEMMDAPMVAKDMSGSPPSGELIEETVMVSDTTQQSVIKQSKPVMQIRRDFRETAFFYPSMETDSTGSLILEFTVPESLSRWRLLGLAHTKGLDYTLLEKELVTRKDLMVFPNAPRFVRQGDTVIFSAKIVNLSTGALSGKVTLALTDGISQQSLNKLAAEVPGAGYGAREQDFTAEKGQSAVVSWRLIIPYNAELSVLQYRVTAVAGNYTDGEEKAIPVLTNRMMVTESLPLPVRGKGTFIFSFNKLLNQEKSDSTLKNYKLTLEFASNPAWYAIQALPSLDDQPYEHADAIFAKYWTNSLAAFIANSNPKIKAVFESWKSLTPDALQSNLAKNQQLKSALLQETPWVTEALNETGRKQKLGLWFDQDNLAQNLKEGLLKLQRLQSPNGGWTWFPGMPENRYITQNILTGLGKLHHLGVAKVMGDPLSRNMVLKAIGFLDGELLKDLSLLKKNNPSYLKENHLGNTQVQYLYARSFFMNDPAVSLPVVAPGFDEAFGYYKEQASKYWVGNERSLQAMIALALNRTGIRDVPQLIMKSLAEKALHSNEMGMYWAYESGYYWYQAPIETQAMMIEAFDEVMQDKSTVEDLKVWLLKQKQIQDWRTPRATLEACYALLLRGTDLLADDPGVKISLGKQKISSDKLSDVTKEVGTGYFQLSWSASDIRPEMGKITVTKTGEGVAWGAVYWQYFENLDKITPAATPLHLEKKLFVEKNTPSGPVLEAISYSPDSPTRPTAKMLNVGDKIVVRVILSTDRNLEFVHLKDMRASALEPLARTPTGNIVWGGSDGLSGYRYQDGLGYYQATTDLATNFFFDYLPKGTYVFEYPLKVNAAGDFSNGITTVQCLYAPEFSAHSEGIRLNISGVEKP